MPLTLQENSDRQYTQKASITKKCSYGIFAFLEEFYSNRLTNPKILHWFFDTNGKWTLKDDKNQFKPYFLTNVTEMEALCSKLSPWVGTIEVSDPHIRVLDDGRGHVMYEVRMHGRESLDGSSSFNYFTDCFVLVRTGAWLYDIVSLESNFYELVPVPAEKWRRYTDLYSSSEHHDSPDWKPQRGNPLMTYITPEEAQRGFHDP